MSDYLAGTEINALDFPVAVYASDNTQINDVTSTTYIVGTPEVSVTFIAPTSGRVWLIVGGGVGNSTGSRRIFLAPEVRVTNSAGAVVLAPTVALRGFAGHKASAFHYAGRRTLLIGLSPGQQYYARVMYAVSGTTAEGTLTGDIACRDITVAPAT